MSPTPCASVVYASARHDPSLTTFLEQDGWRVERVGAARDLEKAMQRCTVSRVGLVDLDDDSGPVGDWLMHSMAIPEIRWVARLGERALKLERVRQAVIDYCADFVVSRCEFESLASVLSHASSALVPAPVTPAPGARPRPNEAHALIIGESKTTVALLRSIEKTAATDAPLFIYGETGTGKELTAHAVHATSRRADKPFVVVNCGALPENLMQSELFGHERGAFTGANHRAIGRIEAAHGGTLFLDEIGDLPLSCQASLLRFIQEGSIERLGGLDSIRIDARIICATHVDLDRAVAEGRFRLDLYHRLCVIRLNQPPLRERGQDIETLAHHFLARFAHERRRQILGFKVSALEAMRHYAWPGNIREMSNRIRRAVVMSEGRLISAHDLEFLQRTDPYLPMTLADARNELERQCVERCLARHGQNLVSAAQELGVSRVTLYRLRVRYGLCEADPPRIATPPARGAVSANACL